MSGQISEEIAGQVFGAAASLAGQAVSALPAVAETGAKAVRCLLSWTGNGIKAVIDKACANKPVQTGQDITNLYVTVQTGQSQTRTGVRIENVQTAAGRAHSAAAQNMPAGAAGGKIMTGRHSVKKMYKTGQSLRGLNMSRESAKKLSAQLNRMGVAHGITKMENGTYGVVIQGRDANLVKDVVEGISKNFGVRADTGELKAEAAKQNLQNAQKPQTAKQNAKTRAAAKRATGWITITGNSA